jgi:hypothetical protein
MLRKYNIGNKLEPISFLFHPPKENAYAIYSHRAAGRGYRHIERNL